VTSKSTKNRRNGLFDVTQDTRYTGEGKGVYDVPQGSKSKLKAMDVEKHRMRKGTAGKRRGRTRCSLMQCFSIAAFGQGGCKGGRKRTDRKKRV